MRVLHIIDHWGLGGAQRAVADLVRHERTHNHAIISIYQHHCQDWDLPGQTPLWFLAEGYASSLKACFGLRRIVRQWRPDVIQVHLNGARFLCALGLWGMRQKPPLIWHEHSGKELTQLYGNLMGGVLLGWQRRLIAGATHVVGNSSSSLAYLANHLNVHSEKMSLIHCLVDSAQIRREAAIQPSNVPEGVRTHDAVVGFVGRLASQKGPDDLLKIARSLRNAKTQAQLWVVGDGPERAPLERRLQKEGLADGVVFWGLRRDVYAIMQAMQVIVMPSRYEPFGLVAVEAFVLGKPVVAYAVDGLAEVLRLSPLGKPIEPLDVEGFIAAIFEALATRGQKDMPPLDHPFEPGPISKAWQDLYASMVHAD